MAYADTIQNVEQLEDRLSEPTREVVQDMGRLKGDLILLGVSGKMGPSLARMARRASDLARPHRICRDSSNKWIAAARGHRTREFINMTSAAFAMFSRRLAALTNKGTRE